MADTPPLGEILPPATSQTAKPLLQWKDIGIGLMIYALSSTVVLLAALLGYDFIEGREQGPDADYITSLTRWDSTYYRDIAVRGYWWDPESSSGVAFFPVYPLVIRAVWKITNERVELIQVWVANVLLALSFILLHAYARLRLGDTNQTSLTLLAFAIFPTTLFFRIGYSESTFFLIVVVYFLAAERRWPLPVLALICGLATAARPPGIALLPALLFEVYRRPAQRQIFSWHILGYGLLGCWGLLSYIVYQGIEFGHPLAFAQTQQYWNCIQGTPGQALASGLILEPIWNTYNPVSERYWGLHPEFRSWWVFNLYFANPILFVGTALLVIWGSWKRILTPGEALVSAGLLLIPYVTKSFGQSMHSFGRFASVVLPVYLVMGYLLSKLPVGIMAMVLVFLSFWLILFSIFFGAGQFAIT